MPVLGLGTWNSAPGEVGAAVAQALGMGYRHLDCAPIYGNEAEIGAALHEAFAAGVVRREELFVTSKLWNDRHAPDDVLPALRRSLADLRLDQIDLFLIHWPVAHRRGVMFPQSASDFIPLERLPLVETWKGMEAAVAAGLARDIGVSNFSARKLEELAGAARIRPAVNQVELHPYLAQRELVEACRRHRVVVTAYSPLGSRARPETLRQEGEPVLLEDPQVRAVADRSGATPAQVLLAWGLQRGTAVIPKSVHPQRLAENLAAAALVLSKEDMRSLDALDRGRRYVDGSFWALPGSPYTLSGLWDE